MIAYGFLGCGIVIALLSGGLWLQTERLDIAHGSLENCQKSTELLAGSLYRQNKAVTALSEASAKRQKQAAIALKQAREGQGKADAEIARLRGLTAAALDCSGAVQQVKRGMKP